jgi:hypothetical protein
LNVVNDVHKAMHVVNPIVKIVIFIGGFIVILWRTLREHVTLSHVSGESPKDSLRTFDGLLMDFHWTL